MLCPKCKSKIPEKIAYCPKCMKMSHTKESATGFLPFVFAFFTFSLFVVISFIGFVLDERHTKASQPAYKPQPTSSPVMEVEKEPASTLSVVENEGETERTILEEPDLHTFFADFRSAYEEAVNTGNFENVEEYLEYRSPAFFEIRDYLSDIQGEGYTFNFTDNHLIDSTIEKNIAYLDTFELFYFTNAEGKTTKYERSKVYTIKLDPFGYHLISSIEIKDTVRN